MRDFWGAATVIAVLNMATVIFIMAVGVQPSWIGVLGTHVVAVGASMAAWNFASELTRKNDRTPSGKA